MCALAGAAAFAAMFVLSCSTRRAPAASTAFRQNLATELVWAAIPAVIPIASAPPAP